MAEVERLRELLKECHHELTMVDGLLGVRDPSLLQTLAWSTVFTEPICRKIEAALADQATGREGER